MRLPRIRPSQHTMVRKTESLMLAISSGLMAFVLSLVFLESSGFGSETSLIRTSIYVFTAVVVPISIGRMPSRRTGQGWEPVLRKAAVLSLIIDVVFLPVAAAALLM